MAEHPCNPLQHALVDFLKKGAIKVRAIPTGLSDRLLAGFGESASDLPFTGCRTAMRTSDLIAFNNKRLWAKDRLRQTYVWRQSRACLKRGLVLAFGISVLA